MTFKNIFGGFFCFALGSSAALAQHNGEGVDPSAGVWFGGYEVASGMGNRTNEITFEMTSVRGLGHLELYVREWADFDGVLNCDYFFAIRDGSTRETYLNTAEAHSDDCFETLPFAIERVGADRIVLRPGQEVSAAFQLEEIEMSAGLRPPRSQDVLTHPEGVDVLGVQTSMTRASAEEVLLERGFEDVEQDRVLSGDGYTVTYDAWGKDPTEDGEYADTIVIQWSLDKEWDDEVQRIVSVTRDWKLPADAGLTVAALETAVNEKYGAPNGYDLHRYSRNGELPSDQDDACSSGSLQSFDYTIDYPGVSRRSGKLSPHCGLEVIASVGKDRMQTGRAGSLKVSIIDPDILWKDFWDVWSHSQYQSLQRSYESLKGATGAAPDL